MKNLLKETIYELESNNKSTNDVLWVGSGEYVISWEEFVKIADVEYNSGFGGQEIASDLMVVGKDWWLERGEYDGSEWWEFKSIPIIKDRKPFNNVKGGLWEKLGELNLES